MGAINRHFLRHYVEMVVVMFAGMGVLALPAGWALGAVDSSWSELHTDAPALALALMAFTMTAPMVGWMRLRGHSGRANVEMALSMIVPALGVIGLLAVDLVDGVGTLMMLEHVAMLAGMFGVMLLRPEEYSHRHHRYARREGRASGVFGTHRRTDDLGLQ